MYFQPQDKHTFNIYFSPVTYIWQCSLFHQQSANSVSVTSQNSRLSKICQYVVKFCVLHFNALRNDVFVVQDMLQY